MEQLGYCQKFHHTRQLLHNIVNLDIGKVSVYYWGATTRFQIHFHCSIFIILYSFAQMVHDVI